MKTPKLVANDMGLKPYQQIIVSRANKAKLKAEELTGKSNSFVDVGNGYFYYGLHKHQNNWVLREFAPAANCIYITGEFCNWQLHHQYRLNRLDGGNWEIELPLDTLSHGMLYKLLIKWNAGEGERIPAYCRRVLQDEQTKIFSAQVWDPPKPYKMVNQSPASPQYPLIYEAHIGMASEQEKVGTFEEFRLNVLPRVVALGYNVIQLMAIQEHPYYGSFGYQVSNFFAVSSRFGTPDELKHLIDDAHKHGICVVMDIVHSHAVKNEAEGLSKFDGTTDLYFHTGERGEHPLWESRCFDYGKNSVLSFLLSNCKFWLEEYKFDGFRFDGVTSMMYYDHGMGRDFVSYNDYYNGSEDEDAIVYLTLANKIIHEIKPDAITIAEDVSGMPGLAVKEEDGGIGFDFRMSMGVADYWIKLIKEKTDQQWHVGDMFYELTNKRADEKTISYAECHDQAMVGDKTIIFRLIDKDMYDKMNVFDQNLNVSRGMALHKILRLASLSTAGDGYLNFMGNEFGHPEWIDFPREGNGWSYKHARRQWSLSTDNNLRYRYLARFDKDMVAMAKTDNIFAFKPFAIIQNTFDQVLIFKRGDVVFIFNFNPVKSFSDYGFKIDKGTYKVILNTDSPKYDGFDRLNDTLEYNCDNLLKIYLPARSAFVLKKIR